VVRRSFRIRDLHYILRTSKCQATFFIVLWHETHSVHQQLAWVYATSNVKIQIDIMCRIIAGYVYEGQVLANIWFFNLGYISGIKGLAFAQDLKLGIYCNVCLGMFGTIKYLS
jgi:hypothetical protein